MRNHYVFKSDARRARLRRRDHLHGVRCGPAGYLKCNGAAVSRSAYADLFAAIGTTYGAGDGSTTFNVPETRGEFLRCLADGRAVDTGRVRGSAQAASEVSYLTQSTGYVGAAWSDAINMTAGQEEVYNASHVNGGNLGVATVANDCILTRYRVRPRNIAFLTCIRY
jgi:microcystin-dependent protein